MTKQGLLLMMTDIDPANEEDFNRWYEEEHLDERMRIPGFINARRFTALEGGPKYLALYDLEPGGRRAHAAFIPLTQLEASAQLVRARREDRR